MMKKCSSGIFKDENYTKMDIKRELALLNSKKKQVAKKGIGRLEELPSFSCFRCMGHHAKKMKIPNSSV